MPSYSRTPIELSRGRTEARGSGSDRSARTPLRTNLSLPQRAEITENTIARNERIDSDREESEAEPVHIYQDWKMRSPSPVELTYAPIYSTYTPTYFHQPYEDTDIVMASPTHPTRSPTPEPVQDSANLGSYWGAEPPYSSTPTEVLAQDSSAWGTSSSWGVDPPYSSTPTEVLAQDSSAWGTSSSWGVDPPHSPTSEEGQGSRPWGYSPWEADATQDESTEDSSLWGTDATQDESTKDSSLWGTNATQDESTEDSSLWGTESPHSSTPGPLQDLWESFSW